MKRIAIEEHFRPKCHIDYLLSREEPPRVEIIEKDHRKHYRVWSSAGKSRTWSPDVFEKIVDIGVGRLKDMDEVGIDMQVLSSTDIPEGIEVSEATRLASEGNDEMSLAVRKYPDRFAGFASLDLQNPSVAADELERAVKQLGLKGAMIRPHVGGEYIDAKQYRPVFQRAAELGVPLYIHPTLPSSSNRHQYAGYPELIGSMWGFAADTGLAVIRLICSGVFDEYPDLKIILGHMGEALPFWLWRLDNRLLAESRDISTGDDGEDAYTPLTQILKKMPSQYIKENFYVTTSGMLWQPALLCTHQALGVERILFAVDYPFELSMEAVQFIETAPISDSDKEKIFYLNAEKLLNL